VLGSPSPSPAGPCGHEPQGAPPSPPLPPLPRHMGPLPSWTQRRLLCAWRMNAAGVGAGGQPRPRNGGAWVGITVGLTRPPPAQDPAPSPRYCWSPLPGAAAPRAGSIPAHGTGLRTMTEKRGRGWCQEPHRGAPRVGQGEQAWGGGACASVCIRVHPCACVRRYMRGSAAPAPCPPSRASCPVLLLRTQLPASPPPDIWGVLLPVGSPSAGAVAPQLGSTLGARDKRLLGAGAGGCPCHPPISSWILSRSGCHVGLPAALSPPSPPQAGARTELLQGRRRAGVSCWHRPREARAAGRRGVPQPRGTPSWRGASAGFYGTHVPFSSVSGSGYRFVVWSMFLIKLGNEQGARVVRAAPGMVLG